MYLLEMGLIGLSRQLQNITICLARHCWCVRYRFGYGGAISQALNVPAAS